MSNRRGFTLIEITVVMIIVGILVCIIIPNYTLSMNQGMTQASYNNLILIGNAQQNYHFSNGGFCLNNTAGSASCPMSPNCGDTLAALNCNLGINITDTNFAYQCAVGGVGPSGQWFSYVCDINYLNPPSGGTLDISYSQPLTFSAPTMVCNAGPLTTSWCPH